MNIDKTLIKQYVYGEVIEYRESYINIPIKNSNATSTSTTKLIGIYVINKVLLYGLHFLYKKNNDDIYYSKIKINENSKLNEIKLLLDQLYNKPISHGDIIVCTRPILGYNFNLYSHWVIYDEIEGCVLEYVDNNNNNKNNDNSSGGNSSNSSNSSNSINSSSGSGVDLLNKCILKETNINEFLKRENWIHTLNTITTLDYLNNNNNNNNNIEFTPNQVVERARNLIKCNSINKDYRLLTRNCQHFATYCKFGHAISIDIKNKSESLIEYASEYYNLKDHELLLKSILNLILSCSDPFR